MPRASLFCIKRASVMTQEDLNSNVPDKLRLIIGKAIDAAARHEECDDAPTQLVTAAEI